MKPIPNFFTAIEVSPNPLQRNQLLRTRRMNRHTSIKIPLPRPHLNRDPQPLQHLTASQVALDRDQQEALRS